MPTITIELVGGPRDGSVVELSNNHLALLGGIPDEFGSRRGQFGRPDDPAGRYVITRKLTRRGRLIYEWSTLR